ncbi:hypothetical protein ACFLTE_03730 [Bacteroidota bacterium]
MKKIALFLFFLLIINLCYTQESVKFSGGGGGMQFGYGNIFLNKLNQELIKNSLPEFSGDMFSFGGNGQGVINNFIIGGGMYRYNSLQKINTDTLLASVGMNYGVLNLGYILYDSKNLIGYPLISLGYSTFSLKYSEKTPLTFQNAITDINHEIQIKKGSPVLDIGCVFEFFPLSKEDKLKGGPCIGLKIGGFFTLNTNNWEYSGGEIINAPGFTPLGFYIRTLYKGYVFH